MWDATNLPGWPLVASAATQINVSTQLPIHTEIANHKLHSIAICTFFFLPTSYTQRTQLAGPKIALHFPCLFVCWFACDYVCPHLSCVQ